MKIHAIIKALNEEAFILNQLNTLYPFCDRISIISQYDRDWFGKKVTPDNTINLILNYPDPEGKIHIVIRRFPDETSAVNMEMLSFNDISYKKIIPHGSSFEKISNFHNKPDYFWYVDADEIYDIQTIPVILDYLKKMQPKGMRMIGYNYARTWNHRIPRDVVDFTHFGFIKSGIILEQHRQITWNEFRLKKILSKLRLPDFSNKVFGMITCPESIGVFHHGCWLGDDDRLKQKFLKSSHTFNHESEASEIDAIAYIIVPTIKLPINIQKGNWPKNYFIEE